MKKLRCNPNDRVTPFFLLERGKEMGEKKKNAAGGFCAFAGGDLLGDGLCRRGYGGKGVPDLLDYDGRFLGAAVWMGLLFRRAVKSSTKEDIKAGMILGGLLFLAQPLQIIALRYTTPSKQAFLVTTYVIIVPFISWLVLAQASTE